MSQDSGESTKGPVVCSSSSGVPAGELRRRAPVDVAADHARRSNDEPFPLWLRAPSATNVSFAINVLLLKTEIKQSVPGSPTRNYSFKLEITFCVRGVSTAPCGVPTFVSDH